MRIFNPRGSQTRNYFPCGSPEIHRDWELCRWEFSVGVDLVSARVCAHGLRQAKPLQ